MLIGVLALVSFINNDSSDYYGEELIAIGDHTGVRYEKNSDILNRRIKDIGARAAYEELIEKTIGRGTRIGHDFGHAFGSSLYEEEGIEGFYICDERTYGGCMHEFIITAIDDLGTSVVEMIGQNCLDSDDLGYTLVCQHGIGHGLVSYYGYDVAGLEKAIGLCGEVPNDTPIYGCEGGAYMEYNMRTILPDTPTRPIEDENWSTPCDELSEEHVKSCYHWLPQAWHAFFDGSEYEYMGWEKYFDKLAKVCEQQEGVVRAACLAGVAKVAPIAADFDSEKTHGICSAMSEPSSRFICKTFAANNLAEELATFDEDEIVAGRLAKDIDPVSICDGLVFDELEYCKNSVFDSDSLEILEFKNTPLDKYGWIQSN